MKPDFTLGILAGDLAARSVDGRLLVSSALGRLADSLRALVPNSRICVPVVPGSRPELNHAVSFSGSEIEALPPLETTIAAQKYYFAVRRIVRRFAASVDVLFVRMPFQLPHTLIGVRTPKVLQVLGNVRAVVDASTDYGLIRRPLAKLFAHHTESVTRRLVAEYPTRTVTHGEEMWKILGCQRGRVIVSSNIFEREIQPRNDWRPRDPPRLLFVGFLRPEKGIGTLLDAFELISQKRDVRLSLVGGSDRRSQVEEEAVRRIERSPYRDRIQMHGIIPLGEPLFQMYRDNDVFVLPSLSEGTPRTLVEARAFGCPVVATRVGGVPTSVEHEKDGLLVEPGDAQGTAAAILRLLDDAELRERLVAEGLRRSKERTLEAVARKIVEECAMVAPRAQTPLIQHAR